jgi:hypothetical protein
MVDGSDVEILVHTTAPSRGPDDARYRALAHAYLNFQPTTKQKIKLDTATRVEEEPGSQLLGELNQSTQEERESEASYRPDEEEDSAPSRASVLYDPEHIPGVFRSLSSPGLSFTSVLDSPVFRPPITWHQPASQSESGGQRQESEGVWPDAPSTVADSQPENDRIMAARASPATIMELRLQQMDTSEETSIAATASQRSTHPSSQSISNEGGVPVVPVVPMLPTLPLPISESSRARNPEVQVARTSSADEVVPARPQAGHSLPAMRTPYDSKKTTTTSGSVIPDTPTPAVPPKARDNRPTHSSSPSFGSAVPATSTPAIVSSSGHEMTVDDSNSGANMEPKPDTPAPPKGKGRRTPLPSGKITPVGMGSQKTPESQQVASSAPSAPPAKTVPKKSQPKKKQHPELTSSQSASKSYRIPISDDSEISMSVPSSQTVSEWADKLDIRPPMPAASTAKPKLLWPITQNLADLAKELTNKSPFVPVFRARELRELERGYWRVSSGTWNSKVKVDAWKRLGDFIGKGKAGWGCSCVRFEDSPEIRVYCPGNMVSHIYFVLVMATANKVKDTGASWIGGDGEPVIKMLNSVESA